VASEYRGASGSILPMWLAFWLVVVAIHHDYPIVGSPPPPHWHLLTYPLWGLGGWIAGALITTKDR